MGIALLGAPWSPAARSQRPRRRSLRVGRPRVLDHAARRPGERRDACRAGRVRDRGGRQVRGAQLPPGRARRRRCQHGGPVRRQADVEGEPRRRPVHLPVRPARSADEGRLHRRHRLRADSAAAPGHAAAECEAVRARRRAPRADRRSQRHDLAQDARREEDHAAPAGRVHLRRARPVGEPQRSAARCGRGEVDRRRLRRDADVARGAAKRHARRPVRPAQGDDEARSIKVA